MPLDLYMTLCLTHPKFGFYMKGEPLGARGAFTTAPEVSQMFGELVGAWCHAAWAAMGSPQKFHWIELGPGRGTLFADALRFACLDPKFIAAAQGWLIEISPVLRDVQLQRLRDTPIPLAWLNDWAAVPTDAPMIVIANEFFDALPIRQAVRKGRGWHERKIGLKDGELKWGLAPDLLSSVLLPDALRDESDNTVVEFAPARETAMRALSQSITSQGGVALIIDYGYQGPRPGDTFQALQAQGFTDPLATPGDADVTAHVDFTSLARAASPLLATQLTGQGDFLRALGLDIRAHALMRHATSKQSADISSAVHRLTHPAAMGDLFKVMAICHETVPPLPGFRV